MSRHATSAVLSAYLDEELHGAERVQVEKHLETCEPCREHLMDMKRVVLALRGLERQAVPQVLGQTVVQRVESYGKARSLMSRLEARLEGLRLDTSPFVTFALVLAFAVILVAFAASIQHSRETTRLVVLPHAQEIVIGDRVFERREGMFVEEGVEPEAARSLVADSAEARLLRGSIPEIDGLLLELPVVLQKADGEVIEILPLDD